MISSEKERRLWMISHLIGLEEFGYPIIKCVPTSDTTPGYPLWQANRGKGFKAPVVTGPELPVHMFDDPIYYKAELEYRYENAFRRLEEKEIILIQQWQRRRDDLCHHLDKKENEVIEQKEKVKVLEAQFMRMKERCHSLETILGKRNQDIIWYRGGDLMSRYN
ncbi:hypothetical protein PIB30_056814 [Stylosanthes scabra]|uniref:Uncharacterized protein n=1 Tax=Stylosanthes scabra TaxID=79078 RepID=A0ABU6UL22_9FABA|nr:hypothetical protein [Stylosanthes scabra]